MGSISVTKKLYQIYNENMRSPHLYEALRAELLKKNDIEICAIKAEIISNIECSKIFPIRMSVLSILMTIYAIMINILFIDIKLSIWIKAIILLVVMGIMSQILNNYLSKIRKATKRDKYILCVIEDI